MGSLRAPEKGAGSGDSGGAGAGGERRQEGPRSAGRSFFFFSFCGGGDSLALFLLVGEEGSLGFPRCFFVSCGGTFEGGFRKIALNPLTPAGQFEDLLVKDRLNSGGEIQVSNPLSNGNQPLSCRGAIFLKAAAQSGRVCLVRFQQLLGSKGIHEVVLPSYSLGELEGGAD